MYLQKQLSRKVGNKEYAKYVIVIKPKYIEELGWKEGEELEAEVKKDKLIIEKDQNGQKGSKRMDKYLREKI